MTNMSKIYSIFLTELEAPQMVLRFYSQWNVFHDAQPYALSNYKMHIFLPHFELVSFPNSHFAKYFCFSVFLLLHLIFLKKSKQNDFLVF